MIDISPRASLERLLRLWWVLALATLLGGLAGWLFSRFQPPVYEATALYRVELNTAAVIQRLSLDPEIGLSLQVQNNYYGAVKGLVTSTAVLSDLETAAREQGLPVDTIDYDISLLQSTHRFMFVVRSPDPELAAQVANLWMQIGDARLQESRAYAVQALVLELQRDSVYACFQDLDFTSANACAGTAFTVPTALDFYMDELNAQIETQRLASANIDAAFDLGVVELAELPASPVLYSVSTLIFAGMVFGFLMGITGVEVLPAWVKHGCDGKGD
ncbi:MAG: hypothetical protein JXB85_05905 [Anaerolineales bacterium]|nr:hypothetical protein [Anaerolineales bacterium]